MARQSYSRFINTIDRYINDIEYTDEDDYTTDSDNDSDSYHYDNDDSIIYNPISDDSESSTDNDYNSTDEVYHTNANLYIENDYDQGFIHELDMMYDEDRDHMDSDKDNNNYYIGIYKHIKITDSLMFLASVSTRVYYNYSFDRILSYLKEYSTYHTNASNISNIDIMQLKITDDNYMVILKTHWLRLVQRAWKKRFAAYKEIRDKRKNIQNILYRETHGNWPNGLNTELNLHGILSPYNNKP